MSGDRGGFAALDSCVHCGFCLQACPKFLATGDEADSPRGRIALMRALEQGELTADAPDLTTHLDRCLGCRACEPVCPSGVGYGRGLEAAREVITTQRGAPVLAKLALWALTTPAISRFVYALVRALRSTGVPAWLAGWNRFGFAMGMLAATKPKDGEGRWRTVEVGGGAPRSNLHHPSPTSTTSTVLFRGCIMQGLFRHVHDATIRTLAVNGYAVREAMEGVCCGALHAHAGLADEARALARANVAALAGDDPIVVNSAGCGAMLREYSHLLPDDPAAAALSTRVRDVTELLAARGPAPGAPLDRRVAYDPPCHLLHAQRVADPPLAVLGAIPILKLVPVPEAEQCCGSAGLFTLVQPEMSRAVLGRKLEHLRAAAPQVVATGNPGCVMQIGAGLRAAGVRATLCHPVELLDASYAAAGHYA